MLPNNELGKLIASTWKDTPSKEKKPIIVFADESTINQKQINVQKIRKNLISKEYYEHDHAISPKVIRDMINEYNK